MTQIDSDPASTIRRMVEGYQVSQAIQVAATLGIADLLAGANRTCDDVERVIAPANEGRDAKFSDLNMLVGPGGRERTHEEFAALLESSELRLERVHDAGSSSVVEATSA